MVATQRLARAGSSARRGWLPCAVPWSIPANWQTSVRWRPIRPWPAFACRKSSLAAGFAELSEKLGENHPRLIQARNELGTVQRSLRQRNAEHRRGHSGPNLDAAKSEEDLLKVQSIRHRRSRGEASQYEAELKQLEREAQSNRAVYASFLNRFKELREQQDIQRPDARVLAYARPSSSPSSPQYQSALMIAFRHRLHARHGGSGDDREA